jgi:hypothetical protein
MCEPCKHDCMPKDIEALTSKLDSEHSARVDRERKLLEALTEIERLKADKAALFDMRGSVEAENERLKVFLKDEGIAYSSLAKSYEDMKLQVDVLLRVLGKVEWVYETDLEAYYCPMCGNGRAGGHMHSCELRAALEKKSETRVGVCGKMAGCALESGHRGLCAENRFKSGPANWDKIIGALPDLQEPKNMTATEIVARRIEFYGPCEHGCGLEKGHNVPCPNKRKDRCAVCHEHDDLKTHVCKPSPR